MKKNAYVWLIYFAVHQKLIQHYKSTILQFFQKILTESSWNRVGQLNGQEFEQTLGDSEQQGRLVCCSPWGCRLGHNLATQHQLIQLDGLAPREYLHLQHGWSNSTTSQGYPGDNKVLNLAPAQQRRERQGEAEKSTNARHHWLPARPLPALFHALEAASFLPLSFLLLSQNQAPFHQAPLSPVWAQNPAPMAHRAASPPTKRLEAAATTCSHGCQHWEQHLLSACPEILLEVWQD